MHVGGFKFVVAGEFAYRVTLRSLHTKILLDNAGSLQLTIEIASALNFCVRVILFLKETSYIYSSQILIDSDLEIELENKNNKV